jgi:hypothetical protein
MTKASFDAFLVSLQEILVCNSNEHWFLESKCWGRRTSLHMGFEAKCGNSKEH